MDSIHPICVFCMYEANDYVKCVKCTAVSCRSHLITSICKTCPQCRHSDANGGDWFMDTINIESTASCTTACGEDILVTNHNDHIKSCLKCEIAELRPWKKQCVSIQNSASDMEFQCDAQRIYIHELVKENKRIEDDLLKTKRHLLSYEEDLYDFLTEYRAGLDEYIQEISNLREENRLQARHIYNLSKAHQ